MQPANLSLREIEKNDVEHLVRYWIDSDREFMEAMGVDVQKISAEENLREMISEQLYQNYSEKKAYCIIWLANGEPVGHCNVNKIKFGEEAYMHLHFWNPQNHKKGNGTKFVRMTLPYFFNNLNLKNLYCEPYALNPAPNKTLEKCGFTFVKKHTTIPGYLNFEQEANLWLMSRDRFEILS